MIPLLLLEYNFYNTAEEFKHEEKQNIDTLKVECDTCTRGSAWCTAARTG